MCLPFFANLPLAVECVLEESISLVWESIYMVQGRRRLGMGTNDCMHTSQYVFTHIVLETMGKRWVACILHQLHWERECMHNAVFIWSFEDIDQCIAKLIRYHCLILWIIHEQMLT